MSVFYLFVLGDKKEKGMSKVLTFSRVFPGYHPKKGQPTFFVEKILKCFEGWGKIIRDQSMASFVNDFALATCLPKYHTIRSGKIWKVGDKFSPRIWSGKPYASKQITIIDDVEIKKVWDFESDSQGLFKLDGNCIDVTSCDIPKNDGLSSDDFLDWFPVGKIFNGQIICWNENIDY